MLSFKHLLKMTGCVCGTCLGDEDEEEERTLRVGFMAGLAMGSLGLTFNGIAPKMSRLKTSACLAADGHVLYLSYAKPVVAIETRNIAYSGTLWFIIKRVN